MGEDNTAAYAAALVGHIPIGRLAGPEEVADAVTLLASSDSSFLIGANLYVNGGVHQI